MALNLDENQIRIVDTKRKAPGQKPTYYSATQAKSVPISDDFEAFLILQGRQRNSDTVKWLEQSTQFAKRDIDRDALASQAIKLDFEDAEASQGEIGPYIRLFQRFRESYNMTGFENVTEAGVLLNDVQKAMSEINHLNSRLKHRKNYATISLTMLSRNGVTPEQTKQINSWFAPLTAY